MDKGQFYIAFIERSARHNYADVKARMDLAASWYRLNENLWALYTTSDAEKWNGRLSSLARDDGNLFVCRLDVSDRQGWMSESFWHWIREHHRSS